jgi:phage gpG-like protein
LAQQEIKDVFGPIASEIRQSLGRGVLTMGESLANAIRVRTKAGISSEGRPFLPYEPKYATRKGNPNPDLYGTPRVSRRTRRMVDALQVQEGSNGNIKANAAGTGSRLTGAGGRFVTMDQGKNITLTIGMDPSDLESLKVATTHQTGSLRRNIPARPWIGVNAQEEQQAFDVLTRELRLPPGTKQVINVNLKY